VNNKKVDTHLGGQPLPAPGPPDFVQGDALSQRVHIFTGAQWLALNTWIEEVLDWEFRRLPEALLAWANVELRNDE
jgi:hypothetical protein